MKIIQLKVFLSEYVGIQMLRHLAHLNCQTIIRRTMRASSIIITQNTLDFLDLKKLKRKNEILAINS